MVVGDAARPGPVLVPFAGTDHDWSAIELGAWLARSWQTPLRIAGPAVAGGRDASRLLASASLAVQRALGVAVEPLLLEPGPEGWLAAATRGGGRRRRTVRPLAEGGPRSGADALAASGTPTLLVRKGLRPGGLAARENLTRFTWSIKVRVISGPRAAACASHRPASTRSAADPSP